MSEDFVSYLFSCKKNDISPFDNFQSKIEKENQYNKYIENTEKISSNAKFIEEFIINDKVVGRKFYNKKGEIKYLEAFRNKKLEIVGISENVTFLHLYDVKEKIGYNENNFIGFRYYEKGPKEKDPVYFTLIKKYAAKYYILEKYEKKRDINGNLFL